MTFQLIFFLFDISFDNAFRNAKLSILIDNIHMEGTVSQIFYIGPRLHFMKSRKIIMKK